MSLRRKNLLEAFRRTDASSPPAGAPPSGSAPASPAGPLFESASERARSRPNRDVAWALGAIGLVFAFVLGFVVGRNTRGEARAEEPTPADVGLRPRPTQPRSFQERPPAAPAEAVATPTGGVSQAIGERRIEDSALFEAANVWTVIVASYTKSNQDLAWATYEHLKDARLPVFPPVESRNLVVVLAGASPTSSELEKIETAVKALARDGKKKDYADAYRARIDTLIPREKKGTSKP